VEIIIKYSNRKKVALRLLLMSINLIMIHLWTIWPN